MSEPSKDGPIEVASPACSMSTADEAYMGFASPEELIAFLNELLEAEMAGARVTLMSAREAGTGEVADLMQAVHHDEARWCAMLARHIKLRDATPSTNVGAFYEKAMAIGDLGERITFLNRGQGWVVRKLREMLPRVRDEALHRDLDDMLQSHVANINLANEVSARGSQ